jgi:hypothetical protein
MSSLPDENISVMMAERHLGKISAMDWAIKGLELGYDSKSLRMLASMLPTDPASVVDDAYNRTLSELGWSDLHPYVFLLAYARFVADCILQGKIDPIEGSRDIYQVLQSTDHHNELHGWYDIDEMIFSQSYYEKTGEKGYYYRSSEELALEIKQACADLLQRTLRSVGGLPETTFDEAEAVFKSFLEDNGYRPDVNWVFAEDMLFVSRGYAIHTPLPEDNRELNLAIFDLAKRRGFGVELHAFLLLNGTPCAYMILPDDELDAQYRLMDKDFVKYSVRLNLPEAQNIENTMVWKLRNLFVNKGDQDHYKDGIPSRKIATGLK